MLSSGANVIIWDEILSSGANVIIWDEMISSGANVIMLQSGANVIIWCYHVMLSSEMTTPPFFIFPENFTHSTVIGECCKILLHILHKRLNTSCLRYTFNIFSRDNFV